MEFGNGQQYNDAQQTSRTRQIRLRDKSINTVYKSKHSTFIRCLLRHRLPAKPRPVSCLHCAHPSPLNYSVLSSGCERTYAGRSQLHLLAHYLYFYILCVYISSYDLRQHFLLIVVFQITFTILVLHESITYIMNFLVYNYLYFIWRHS